MFIPIWSYYFLCHRFLNHPNFQWSRIIAFQPAPNGLDPLFTSTCHMYLHSSLSKNGLKAGSSTFTSQPRLLTLRGDPLNVPCDARDAPVRVEGLIVMLTKPWVKFCRDSTNLQLQLRIFDEPRKMPDMPSYNISYYKYIYNIIYIYTACLIGVPMAITTPKKCQQTVVCRWASLLLTYLLKRHHRLHVHEIGCVSQFWRHLSSC